MLKSEQLDRMMTLTRQKVESKKVEAKNINDDLSVAGLECEENVYESRPETPQKVQSTLHAPFEGLPKMPQCQNLKLLSPNQSIDHASSMPDEEECLDEILIPRVEPQELLFPLTYLQFMTANMSMADDLNDVPETVHYFKQNQQIQDDEEGYLIVDHKDHLLYRFEVISILGKGSFAQVVQAFDHQEQTSVAIKINRNTELDHKFAKNEADLLTRLMEDDPLDEQNIVRMKEQ